MTAFIPDITQIRGRLKHWFLPSPIPVQIAAFESLQHVPDDESWEVMGTGSRYILEGSVPAGVATLGLSAGGTEGSLSLCVDYGLGPGNYTETFIGRLTKKTSTHFSIVRFWLEPKAIWIATEVQSRRIRLLDVELVKPSQVQLLFMKFREHLDTKGSYGLRNLLQYVGCLRKQWRTRGWRSVCEAIREPVDVHSRSDVARRCPIGDGRVGSLEVESLETHPRFSLIIPNRLIHEQQIWDVLNSVRCQYYPYWKINVFTDFEADTDVVKALFDWAKLEPRLKIQTQFADENERVVLERATRASATDVFGYVSDVLKPEALVEVAKVLGREPAIDLVLCQEGFADGKQAFWFARQELVQEVARLETDVEFLRRLARRSCRIRSLNDIRPFPHAPSKRPMGMPARRIGDTNDDGDSAEGPVSFAYQEEPVASFVVVTHNQAHYTADCLKSIACMETTIPFEVIIVDNASADGTRRFLKEAVKGATVLLNEENRFFARACNQGAELSRGTYLVFLNNDTLVARELLDALVQAVEDDDGVGAVGAKLVSSNGKLQEAGAILWRDGTALGYGRGDDPTKEEYSFRREVDFASAACLLVKKELFESVGGFETNYRPAYYEDADLCMKIREKGHRVFFDPFSVVTHREYGTAGEEQAVTWMKQNQDVFVGRWRKRLQEQPKAAPRDRMAVLHARTRNCKGHVLIVDERPPAFDQGAGYPRMYQIVVAAVELGYHVAFSCDVSVGDERYLDVLRKQGVEIVSRERRKAWLIANGHCVDIAILSRPRVFLENSTLVRRYAAQAKLIYDSEALWYRRILREAHLERYPLFGYPGAPTTQLLMREADALKRLEYEAMRAADAIIAVSEDESAEASRINPRAELFQIPTIHDEPRFGPDIKRHDERKDLLFVGGFFNNMRSPNVDAVLYFLLEIFPKILEELPAVRVNIAGYAPPKILYDLAGKRTSIWGDLSVSSLRALYFQSKVAVVPQRFGSGLKSKVTEAMSLGLPLVVSTVAAEGTMLVDGRSAYIADSPDVFAERVVELYLQAGRWREFGRNAYVVATQRYHKERVKSRIAYMLETCVR